MERIGAAKPAAIGLDLLFPEPDRYSPAALAKIFPGLPREVLFLLERLPGNDERLAEVLRGRPVVLAVAGLEPVAPTADPPLLSFAGRLGSIELLARAAQGQGLISAEAPARVVRRLPLAARIEGAIVPALTLEMWRVAARAPGLRIAPQPGGLLAFGVGDLRIPAQADGTAWLRYARHDPQRFVSAAALLEGGVDAELLRGKLVLVGVTGLGLVDHVATPLGEQVPGVELHAQLIEQIFDRAFLVRPAWAPWLEAGMLLIAGLLLVFVVPARRVGLSVAVLAALLALMGAIALGALLRYGLFIDAAWPALGLLAAFALLIGATLAEADRQRRALREAALRAAGELAAARRIQMGLLPDPASLSSQIPGVELAGFLEPARTVGGDFYDCVRLDRERVYFVVGDVAGKGIPAALFMALSKAILKGAAARHPQDPGAILAAAAAEIDRENPEQLFVTAFVGILDLRRGALDYCNAGHEPPYLLAEGAAPLRLPHAGGPPLCSLKGFSYTAERIALPPRSCLCLVSDGITEAMDASGALYGAERVERILAGLAPAASAAAVVDALREDVTRFAGSAASDDVTLLALRWTGDLADGDLDTTVPGLLDAVVGRH